MKSLFKSSSRYERGWSCDLVLESRRAFQKIWSRTKQVHIPVNFLTCCLFLNLHVGFIIIQEVATFGFDTFSHGGRCDQKFLIPACDIHNNWAKGMFNYKNHYFLLGWILNKIQTRDEQLSDLNWTASK